LFTPNNNLRNGRVIGVVPNFTWQMIHSVKLSRADVQNVQKLAISRNFAKVQYKESIVVQVTELVEVLVLITGLDIVYIMLIRSVMIRGTHVRMTILVVATIFRSLLHPVRTRRVSQFTAQYE
jgi:prolipoprotein diacylglyceryltransferase